MTSNAVADNGARVSAKVRVARGAPEALIGLVAIAVNAWRLSQNELGNMYYAAAAKSMTKSFHNFLYASYDPGGFITTDKPPFALWVQAASAKVFGISSWSLLLPSAIAGGLSVWVLGVTVRRVWGRAAGISAAIVLTLTPVSVAVGRSNNPDAILVLGIVLAAWATERAIATSRTKWIVWAGAFVGVGFLSKMLAALIVLPALWLAYFLASKASWPKRCLQLFSATAAIAAISAAWIALMDLTSNSPYMGGSTDGTARDLVFGYNGLGRITGNGGAPGSSQGAPRGFGALLGGGSGVDQFGGKPGWARLFNAGMGDQVMWHAAIVAAVLVFGTVALIRRRKLDDRVGSFVMFATWAIVVFVTFSKADGIFHNYYVSLLAPAMAALVGIGVDMALDRGRAGLLIAAVSVTATIWVQLVFMRRVENHHTWWRWVVAVGLIVGVFAMIAVATRWTNVYRFRLTAIGLAFGGAILAPALWVHGGLQHPQLAVFPDARPLARGDSPASQLFGGNVGRVAAGELAWLERQRTTETWILAVDSSMQAGGAIVDGHSLMAMGGFSGADAAMTPNRLAELVAKGKLRFVSSGGFSFGGAGRGPAKASDPLRVNEVVPQACVAVDGVAWGPSGASGVYDCRGKAAAIRAAKRSTATGSATTPGVGIPPGSRGFPGGPGGPGGPGSDPGLGGPGGLGGQGGPDFVAKMAACLRGQGIDVSKLPQPTGGQPPDLNDPRFSDPKVAAGLQKCLGQLGFPGRPVP